MTIASKKGERPQGKERWGRRSTSVTFAALLTGALMMSPPARAQASPASSSMTSSSPSASLPDSTEVYLLDQILPETAVSKELWRRFSENPLGGLFNQILDHQLSVSLDRDLWSWFKGRIFVAWVRIGERSPMDVYYEYTTLASRYSDLEHALERLGAAADSYKEEHKKFPTKIDAILQDASVDPSSFDGVQISMQITPPQGTGPQRTPWRAEIRADYDAQNALSRYATPPRYTLGKEEALVTGQRQAAPPLGLVVGLESQSSADSNRVLDALSRQGVGLKAEASQPALGPAWGFDGEGLHWTVTNRAGWVLLSDQASQLERFGAGSDGHSLDKNLRYQFQQGKLFPSSATKSVAGAGSSGITEKLSGFVDLRDIWDHTSAANQLGVKNPAESLGMRAWQIQGKTSVPREAYAQMFLQLSPKAGNPIAGWLARPAAKGEEAAASATDLAREIPWGTNLVYAVNLPEISRLIQALSLTDPMLEFGIGAGMKQLEAMTGLPLRLDQLAVAPGWASFYSESSDNLAFILRSYLMMQSHVVRPQGESAPDAARKDAVQEAIRSFPLSISLDVHDPDLYQKTLAKLNARLGAEAVVRQEGQMQWKRSQEGQLALATTPNHIYWANGYTERLLVRELKVATGLEPSVADLDSFRQFQAGLTGRMIAFAHIKSDWVYSILKGTLLSLGADFRAEATALGELRDTYLAATVQPDGIRFAVSLYASQQVPEVKKR